MLTQLGEWARLGLIRRTGAGTYALDTPPPNWPPDHLADQLTARATGVTTPADSDKEQHKVQHPQQSKDEQACATTNTAHTEPTPASDTPTASSTRSPNR